MTHATSDAKSYVIPFSELDKSDLSVAGGKGANLGEICAAGLPVPSGFVISTAAYGAFVQANELQQSIVELAEAVVATDPHSVTAAAEQINDLFMRGTIGEDLVSAITTAHAHLVAESGTEDGLAVAVRSSATAEDLPSASFAGQQDTYLNIRGSDALLDAVKRCWASLWTARAIAYRARQGIDPASVRLAVVVQQLVPADAAGILFTANPVNGHRDQMLINATWGLGEAIVGGEVTPDTIVVEKATQAILAHEIATKRVMTVRTESGTEQQPVPSAQQTRPAVDGATAQQLAHYGAQIEAHYGMPMDIEWAIAAGQIAILQARPITSLPPAPLQNVVWEPVVPNTIWMRRQIVEHMPEPLSPLFEDLYVKRGLKQSIAELFQIMAAAGNVQIELDDFMAHSFAATINGYAYTTGSYTMTPRNLWAIAKIYTRIFKLFKMPMFDWEKSVLPTYQATIEQWRNLDLTTATDETLLRGIREMALADSRYWFGSAPNLGLSRLVDPLFDWLLKSPLFRHALPPSRPGSSSFLRGFDSKALAAQADMEVLADTIRGAQSLRDLVMATAAGQLRTALAAHPDGQPVLDSIQQYLDEYGHQIYNLDFAEPTQNEDPLPLLLSLKALVASAPEQRARDRQTAMAAAREALVTDTMRALNPLTRQLFQWVWRWTKHYAPYRERVMFYMGAAWPTLRVLAHELGQRLTAAGVIADPDEIYYLQSSEIAAASSALANSQEPPVLVAVAQERRALRSARQRLTPPPKVPEQSSLKVGPISLSMFDPTPGEADSEGPVLHGYAVGTGRVTAPASVIRSSADFGQMQPGTILVCTTTTPAWTPLFSQAKGLVTDVGGALAHGSIVAREYGIPAVMGTGVATERIQSGMLLAVDGDAGTVTLVDAATGDATVAGHGDEDGEGEHEQRALGKWLLFAAAIVALVAWWRRR